jgi:hypothetical protein
VYPNLSVVLSWLEDYATGGRVANGTVVDATPLDYDIAIGSVYVVIPVL